MNFNLTLQIKNHSIEGRTLFRETSLSVKSGQKIYLTGPSGSGKSTLFRLLTGLDQIDSGSLILNGASVFDPLELRKRVALFLQTPFFWPGSVLDNLNKPFEFKVNSQSEFNLSVANSMLEDLGLPTSIVNKEARSLSGGEKLRVALVRTLLSSPECVLLDEPTAALDKISSEKVESFLNGWADQNRCFIWITHGEHVEKDKNTVHLQLENMKVSKIEGTS